MAAVGVAAAAMTAVGKAAIESYANYEQLAGGVETLFKTSSGAVRAYANNAYKTAGLSANDYMSTITSFAASLLQSLGGDTAAAVEYANTAVTDMSDNANKMGSDIGLIQAAYQGFAKQNYTMLDNLKLGYGGTKTEMERLISDANALNAAQGKLTNYTVDSYADIVSAIHDVQSEMGITGTTALEASTTIQGSVSSMKAAWSNLLTGMADDTQDFDALVNNFVESTATAASNILPRIQTTLSGLGQFITQMSPVIAGAMPTLVADVLPALVSGAASLVSALGGALLANAPLIVDTALQLITQFASYLSDNTDAVVSGAVTIITALAGGLLTALPQLAEAAGEIIVQLVAALVSNLPALLTAAGEIVLALIAGILAFLGGIAETGGQMIDALVAAISAAASQLFSAAGEAIASFISGVAAKFGEIKEKGGELVAKVGEGISGVVSDAVSWGADLIQNFIDGIKSKADALKDSVKGVAAKIKGFLGFSEPTEGPLSNFHTYAPDMMKLFASGIAENEKVVTDQLKKSFDFNALIKQQDVSAPYSYTAATTVRAEAQSAAGASVVINLYPQTMDEAQSDYLIKRVQNELGWALA